MRIAEPPKLSEQQMKEVKVVEMVTEGEVMRAEMRNTREEGIK